MFLRHLQCKIDPKIEALATHERFRPLLIGDGVEIDGAAYPSLERVLAKIRSKDVLPKLLPQFLSLVHGDLTFQNVMTREDGDTKVIDMEAQDSLEAIELDLGKIFQSTHSQYETWSHAAGPLCNGSSPTNITLKFKPETPDSALLDAVRRRWSTILGLPRRCRRNEGRILSRAASCAHGAVPNEDQRGPCPIRANDRVMWLSDSVDKLAA